jgi:hypothetical protein
LWLATFWQQRRAGPRWRYALVALLALLLLGLAGVATADAAVPGDALYGADLALEEVQLRLAADAPAATRLRLQFAGERLQEAEALAAAAEPENVPVALAAYGRQVAAIAATTATAQAAGSAADPLLADVNEAMAGQESRLETIFAAGTGTRESVCESADTAGAAPRHPLAATLAEQYGLSYEAVAEQLCAGASFGELVLALATADQEGIAAETVLALRAQNEGWGQVWRLLGESGAPGRGPGAAGPPRGGEPTMGRGRPPETGHPEGAGPHERGERPGAPGALAAPTETPPAGSSVPSEPGPAGGGAAQESAPPAVESVPPQTEPPGAEAPAATEEPAGGHGPPEGNTPPQGHASPALQARSHGHGPPAGGGPAQRQGPPTETPPAQQEPPAGGNAAGANGQAQPPHGFASMRP